MGQISIFRSIDRSFDCITGSGNLKDILRANSINFDNCVFIVAGRRVSADYTVKDDDIVFIRKIPHMNNNDAAIKQAEMVAAREQSKAKKKAEEIESTDFLSGSKNKEAIGSAIQYLMGTSQVTPCMINKGRYSISGGRGERQFWDTVLCMGYRDIVVNEVKIGNVSVRRFDDVEPQEGVFYFDDGSLYKDEASENFIEITQGKAFATSRFNWAVASENVNKEIKRQARDTGEGGGEDIEEPIVPLNNFPMRVEMCIQFNGLRQFNETGDGWWEERNARIIPDWSNDEGKTWHEFAFEQPGKGIRSNDFRYNSNKEIRFIATYDFKYDEVFNADGTTKSIQVRGRKIFPDTKEHTTNETCYLLYVNSYQFDVQKSREAGELVKAKILEDDILDKVTLLAMHLESNSNTKGNLDEINVVASGTARTWENGRWTDRRIMTSNPAAWVLDIMTSARHRLSQFSDNEIDLENFGEFYEFCEQNGFGCDGVVDKAIKKRTLIGDIVALADAALVYDGTGKYRVAIDKVEPIPIALINPQDVTDIKVVKSFERRPDGMKATWLDKRSWKNESRYVMFDGKTFKTQEQTVSEKTFTYCTDAEHAWKMAQRSLRKARMQPRDITVDVGNEGSYYPLFSVVKVQTEMLKIGLANSVIHRVRLDDDDRVTAIEIGDLVEFAEGNRYGVIVQCQSPEGKEIIHAEVLGSGKTKVLEFKYPQTCFVLPQYGNIMSFGLLDEDGAFDTITNDMKIYKVMPSASGYTLTLKDYNPAMYEYGDIIPEYQSNITLAPTGEVATIPDAKIEVDSKNFVSAATTAAILAARREKTEIAPYAYMENYSYTFYVDADNNPETASVRIPIHVVKGYEELHFWIGEIAKPLGLRVSEYFDGERNERGIQIDTVPSGMFRKVYEKHEDAIGVVHDVEAGEVELNEPIHAGFIDIPVMYSNAYDAYAFGSCGFWGREGKRNFIIGRQSAQGGAKVVRFKFSYSTSRAGCYRGKKDELEGFLSPDKDTAIADNLHTGDFFMWAGTESALAEYSGRACEFRPTCVYKWNGRSWELDNSNESNAIAMNDIMEIGNQIMEAGNRDGIENTQAMSFFKTLAANQFFCDRLTANTAFIEKLFTNFIQLNNGGIIRSSNYNGVIDDDGNIVEYGDKGWAIDFNGNSDFSNIEATNAKIKLGTFFDCHFSGTIESGPLFLSKLSSGKSVVNGKKGSPIGEFARNLIKNGVGIGNYSVDAEGFFEGKIITSLTINMTETVQTGVYYERTGRVGSDYIFNEYSVTRSTIKGTINEKYFESVLSDTKLSQTFSSVIDYYKSTLSPINTNTGTLSTDCSVTVGGNDYSFRLKGLPRAILNTHPAGTVWIDGNGFLRVKT